MGAVISSLGTAAASGLTNLVALGLLSWTAAAAIKVCESSLDKESGEWRLTRCVLASDDREGGGRGGGARGGKPRPGLAGRERKLRSPRDGGTASSSRRLTLELGKQSQGGVSCRSTSSSASFGSGDSKATVASSPPVALASTSRRIELGGGVDDDDDSDGDCDDDDDDSVKRNGSNIDDEGGAVRLATRASCRAQLERAVCARANQIAHSGPTSSRPNLRQSSCELASTTSENCALSASSVESALCAAAGNRTTTTTDVGVARSAARSSPCRFYYCSSSLGTNVGDDRASAPPPPQKSRMLSIAPAAATKSAADTRMTTNNDNISKIRLQIDGTDNNKNSKHSIEDPNQVPDLAMEPIGGCGRQRSIVIKSRQTQFAQTKSAASSLDSGHSSSRGSHSDLSTASSNIITNNNNNNHEGEEDYSESCNNMIHPTVLALLQSTANLTLTKQPSNQSLNLVVGVDTPPPSPLKRSKKMQMLHAGDQLSIKHQRTSSDQHQQQAAQTASRQEHPHQYQHRIQHEPNSSPAPTTASSLQKKQPLTQDATYLTEVPDRKHLSELLAAARPRDESRPPPRPWLSPAQQLQLLSKGRLKQLFQAGRIDRNQYEQLLEVRPTRRSAKSGWHQSNTSQLAQTTSSNDNACRSDSSRNEFTTLSYNVLSDRMVNPKQFPSSPDLALNWLYRSELILRQLLDHDADIVALQELEMEQYESFFRPKLDELGQYSGLFESKSRARTMDSQMRKRVDGCAIFYKRDKFKLVGKHLLEFNQIAMANSRGSEAMLNRVMTKDNIGLVAVLELIDENHNSSDSNTCDSNSSTQRHRFHDNLDDDDETFLEYSPELHTCGGSSRTTSTSASISSGSTSGASGTTATTMSKRIIVCNTHIHWDPNYCDVKLIQTIMLMNELRHIARYYRSEAAAQLVDEATAAQLDESKLLQQQHQQARTPPADAYVDVDVDDDDLKGGLLVPLVLLGDFNSMQKSGVVQFLLNGVIDSSHRDFKEFKYTPCTNSLTPLGRRHREAQQRQLQTQPQPSQLAGPNQNHLLVSRRASDQPAQALNGQAPSLNRYQIGSTGDVSSSLIRRLSSPVTGGYNSQTSSPLSHLPLMTVAPPGVSVGSDEQEIIMYEHPFKLASAYEKGVMPFTNYCTHFKATIDYIFYDNDQLKLLASLGPLDKDWLKWSKLKGFPQMDFPSDHLPLMAKFRLLSLEDDYDDDDDRSSLNQLSSIETSLASATLTKATWHRQQQPVSLTCANSLMVKPNPALVPIINQQRNQRKQPLHINQNLHKKLRQPQPVTAAVVAASALSRSTRICADERAVNTWTRLRRDSPQTVTSNQQQEVRPEPQNKYQGNNNHYNCYLPSQHLKAHLERQRKLQLQSQTTRQHMQFIEEQIESCNQIRNKTNNNNDNDQNGVEQAAAEASRRAARLMRRQLKKLKRMSSEKAWPKKPLLVNLKEDYY